MGGILFAFESRKCEGRGSRNDGTRTEKEAEPETGRERTRAKTASKNTCLYGHRNAAGSFLVQVSQAYPPAHKSLRPLSFTCEITITSCGPTAAVCCYTRKKNLP